MYTNSNNAWNDHFRERDVISVALVVFANAFAELLNDAILSIKYVSAYTKTYFFFTLPGILGHEDTA